MRPSVPLSGWRWTRPDLRGRLSLVFLVVILPAVLLLLAGSYRHYCNRRAANLAQSRNLAHAASALVQAEMDRIVGQTRWALQVTVSAPGVAQARLQEILAANSQFLDAFLLDAQGRVLALAPAGRELALEPALLSQTAALPLPAISDLLLAAPDQRPAIQVLVPGRTADGLDVIAGVTVDARALSARLEVLAQGTGQQLFLCDRRGWGIYASEVPDLPWEARDWRSSAPLQAGRQGEEHLTASFASPLDGGAHWGAAVPVPSIGWAAAAIVPTSDLAFLPDAPTLVAVAALVTLGVLGMLVTNTLSRRLTVPLQRLSEHARALGRGQLNERIEINADDDLASLAAALNTMAGQMEERDRRLRARTAELDAIIMQSADGIAIYGAEGELQRLNSAGIRILGRPPGRIGLPLAEQATWFRIRDVSGMPLDANELPVAAALRGETRVNQELSVEAEGGQVRYLSFSASPLSDARGRIYGAVAIFRDITQEHQAQQEKDDFISLVSHELKTPITSIKGYAQMLQRRAEEAGANERDLKGLRIINDEVDRMVDLINQLLDISRLETQRLQLNLDIVDLVSLTRDVVDRLQMTTTRHTLRLRAPSEPIWVEGDPMRLTQVLGNIIMNAVKYTPGGGPVEIALESQQGRGWVSVRDWGIGIAPEDQPHIFKRFYRGTRRPGIALTGMGLGLYISREIVQRHHGDIVFHSQPGQGSTFLFWLPLAQTGKREDLERSHPRPLPEKRNETLGHAELWGAEDEEHERREELCT